MQEEGFTYSVIIVIGN